MFQGKTILCIVAARGGSKGVPRKNLRPLKGKPLIVWTLEAALCSRHIDRVIVSSDSTEILQIAASHGVEVPFIRPSKFATDDAHEHDVALHAVSWLESQGATFDLIMFLSPTNPLRDVYEIDAVVEFMFAEPAARAVLTVTRCETPPVWADVLPSNRSMKTFTKFAVGTNRQAFPPYYYVCDSIYLIEWEHFKEHHGFLTPDTYAYVTTQRKGFDINTITDFYVAELLIDHPTLGNER